MRCAVFVLMQMHAADRWLGNWFDMLSQRQRFPCTPSLRRMHTKQPGVRGGLCPLGLFVVRPTCLLVFLP